MIHLNDEQLEQTLTGEFPEPPHLSSCNYCRIRLEEKQALATRLRKAFVGIKADSDLWNRIHVAIAESQFQNQTQNHRYPSGLIIVRKHLFSSLAAAAALLLFVLPGVIYVSTSNRAQAVQQELSLIHTHNLSEGDDFVRTNDPNALNKHLHNHTTQHPAMEFHGDLELYGCCVHSFRGRSVATYIVETAEGMVTVLAIPEKPQGLGMERMLEYSQSSFLIWGAVCKSCNMAARRIGETTHLAMGQVSHAVLAAVLSK